MIRRKFEMSKYNVGFTFKEYIPENPWEDCPAMTRNFEIVAVSPTKSMGGHMYFVKNYTHPDHIFYEAYSDMDIEGFILSYEHAKAQFNLE
jgi:hypothetical protein